MSWEQRNNDFCAAQTNAQMAYIEAEREVVRLEDENAKLRELVLTLYMCSEFLCGRCKHERGNTCDFDAENELRELGVEVDA